MYNVFDQFCDSLDAQIDASKSPEEKNQEVIEEIEESQTESIGSFGQKKN